MTRTAVESAAPGRAEPVDKPTVHDRVPTERIRIEQHSVAGLLWFAGWLFTIGFLHLSFWKGVLALVLWPYYVGIVAAPLLRG
jgi:hypothetical protein